ALTGNAVAARASLLSEASPLSISYSLTQGQRASAGRIDLDAVVDLDDLRVEPVLENPGHVGHHFQEHVDANAHVRRDQSTGFRGNLFRLGALLGGKTGRANDNGRSPGDGGAQMLQSSLSHGEVESNVIGRSHCAIVIRDR